LKNEGCRVRVRIDSERGESREPRDPILETLAPVSPADGAWREYVYTYTVPANYSNVRFELNVVAPGTLWVDDVRIERLPPSG
jgi:hypothetical protein